MSDNTTQEQIKELIVARLQVLPPDASISIGSEGNYTRDELITHVENDDDIGKKITEIELEYLKALKEGIFYAQNTPSH